jgi:UDP-N-acetylmuramoylalanine--D-glutamate ligase
MGARVTDWSSQRVAVLGLGVAGFALADALMQAGAQIDVFDEGVPSPKRADILRTLGVGVHGEFAGEFPDVDWVVTSPGLPPHHAFHAQALERGIPILGELELAWRMRPESNPAPWLLITGTNGKTTTTLMLTSMLTASGARAMAAGNIGVPLIDVVLHDQCDVIAVEVGAPQLPFMSTVSPLAAVCLNIADDHLDHFGSADEYRAMKARIYQHTQSAAIYNVEDPLTRAMVEQADVVEGCRAIGFTRGIPAVSMLGVVDDVIVDRAFISQRSDAALELAQVSDVHPAAPHNLANALAAAALARAYGVQPRAIREGLRNFTPAAHRITDVGVVAGVRYVDDSKATNTHAAQTAMDAYESIIWIAGGMAKGQSFADLVRHSAPRLRGAVLIGVDQQVIADALERHAPAIPVIRLAEGDTEVMAAAVQAATALAQPGDTVLLAPGCASWDIFRDYAERGDLFAAAVRALGDRA